MAEGDDPVRVEQLAARLVACIEEEIERQMST
jgi:hypothetical protein